MCHTHRYKRSQVGHERAADRVREWLHRAGQHCRGSGPPILGQPGRVAQVGQGREGAVGTRHKGLKVDECVDEAPELGPVAMDE